MVDHSDFYSVPGPLDFNDQVIERLSPKQRRKRVAATDPREPLLTILAFVFLLLCGGALFCCGYLLGKFTG